MEVSPLLWKNTHISEVLNIFTGKMAEILQDKPPRVIGNFDKSLPLIFRRWYFLRISETKELSPADFLDECRAEEKWPKNGQFIIHPQLILQDKPQKQSLEIDLNVDYISFMEQPFIMDIKRGLVNEHAGTLFFPHDKVYHETILRTTRILHALDIHRLNDTFDVKTMKEIWSAFITSLCAEWQEEDPFLGGGFSLEAFIDFWVSCLKTAATLEEIFIDDVIDNITAAVRKVYPGWSYSVSELEQREMDKFAHGKTKTKKNNSFEEMKIDTFIHLGKNLDAYFLTPLSIYLQFIEPYYADLQCWEADIQEALNHQGNDITLLFSDPCATFKLTSFGKTFVRGCLL